MQKQREERQEAEQVTATDERLLAALDEIELLLEQVESWRGLVQSLNLDLQQTKQELKSTNEDLSTALMLERVSFDQAKALAKTILKSDKSAMEYLAELIAAIYGCSVKSEELEQIDRSSIITTSLKNADDNRIVANSKELRTHSKQLHEQHDEIEDQFVSFKARFTEFKEKLAGFIEVKKRVKDNVTINHSKSNFLSYSPPPLNKCS